MAGNSRCFGRQEIDNDLGLISVKYEVNMIEQLNIEGVVNKIEELKEKLLLVHKKIRMYENKARILEANLRAYTHKLSQLKDGEK